MKLTSIKAENYRTLQNLTLTFPKSYCTISGKNNAGKSSVIRLLTTLFQRGERYPWVSEDFRFDYKEDRTQWVKQKCEIQIAYSLELSKEDDPALISFIEKMASTQISTPAVALTIAYSVTENDETKISAFIDDVAVADSKAAKEIDKKIKDSNLLFLYNSTLGHREFYYGRGRRRMFFEFVMSEEEKKEMDEAGRQVERRLRKLAKEHREGLNTILGRLSERYDVEFSPPEKFTTRHMPIGINLRDKNVEVPIDDWGSGTQNRTQILMAILQANRIKTTETTDEKITPVVVLEEPESFLHPSAQSEFGKMLATLAKEFGVQIIVTTHSPYMLNRDEPGSNILLSRQVRRGKAYATQQIDTAKSEWMAPFAEHLGLEAKEFESWRPVFSAYRSKVLLVEGDTDKEYFEFLQKNTLAMDALNTNIEIVSYGGKDTLKNSLLVKFVLSKFDKVFITYDLDADSEVNSALQRLALKQGRDFLPLGLAEPGKNSIEGLLPQRVLSAVQGRETDLVMKLGARENDERRNAKQQLKKLYLAEFRKRTDYSKDELRDLAKAVRAIDVRLA